MPPHSSGMKCHTHVSTHVSSERRRRVRLDSPRGHVTRPASFWRRAASVAAPLASPLLLLGGTGSLGHIFLKNVAARPCAALGALALGVELACGSSSFSFEVHAGECGRLGSSSSSPCLGVIPRRACGALRSPHGPRRAWSPPQARGERGGRLPDRVVLRTLFPAGRTAELAHGGCAGPRAGSGCQALRAVSLSRVAAPGRLSLLRCSRSL